MSAAEIPQVNTARSRLIEAAKSSFLADDYHNVSTRQTAEKAGANVSMTHYHFGSKEGLYEEMIRETLNPLLGLIGRQVAWRRGTSGARNQSGNADQDEDRALVGIPRATSKALSSSRSLSAVSSPT